MAKVASRIASAASDHENENRRMWVRAVATAASKCSRATAGTKGGAQLVEREELAAEQAAAERCSSATGPPEPPR